VARKRKKASFSIVFLMLGVLIGYAAAAIIRSPVPQEQPLPRSVTPLEEQAPGVQNVVEEPGGYTEPEMIFRGYLGVHNNRIAIFQGKPPDGVLQHITEYEVRDDLRESLENGVPFHDTGELLGLLENYTS
jgi:hypothetical protein